MDPSQYYAAEAAQMFPGPEYALQYSQVDPAADALQAIYNAVAEDFKISFKTNEKNTKNPSQVVVDDTLHCMPCKAVCVYLGKRIPLLEDGSSPRVLAFLKFDDDKKRNSPVLTCAKHRENSGGSVLGSEDDGLIVEYDKNRSAYVLIYAYPSGEKPSISLYFNCSSSCFQRTVFELNIELVFPGAVFSLKHLVKVSANPGRDSGQPSLIANEFARIKGAFAITSKPRARKLAQEPESQPKRRAADEPSTSGGEQVQPEESANGVYTLTIYGAKPFCDVLNYYHMMTNNDKYKLMKSCGNQTTLLNSQILPSSELDTFLEKARMKKYKHLLNTQGIHTMMDLHKVYNATFFEKDLGISLEDATVLHPAFIYWRTSYLHKVFNGDENALE